MLFIRRLKGIIAFSVSTLCAMIGLFFIVYICYSLLKNGLDALGIKFFTKDYTPLFIDSDGGGLRHALLGHLLITLVACFIGIPFGIGTGIYLSEYGKNSKFGRIVSFLSDMIASVPTIIIGLFVFGFAVYPFNAFNGWAGSIALAVILLPIIVRSTEESMRMVPDVLREAAFALGAPYYMVIKDVILKSAMQGVITGVIFSVSRALGEAAPLLLTSLSDNSLSFNMFHAMPSLTVTIYNYANSPQPEFIKLAWGGSLVITMFILIVNLITRFIFRRKK